MAADEGLAREERREAGDLAHDEGHHGEDQRFGGQYPASLRDGDQASADHPRRVLGADEEHPEHGDGNLGDEHPRLADPGRVPAQLVGDGELGVAVGGDRADGGPQGDAEHDGHAQRPERRPDRTELGPLRAQHVAEGGCGEGRPVVRTGAGDRGAGHRVTPAAWYSTLSRVSSMNASSSEARTGMSSNRVMPWAAASLPTSALSMPVISMTSGSVPAWTLAPASRQRAASSAAWGLRTCTDCWELDRTNSSTLVSAISRPLRIVRGAGGVTWLMPSDKPFARRLATSSRPTRRSTSSTRLRGMPLLWARHSRWSKTRRPPCTALASSKAPTSCMGAGRSR